MITESEQDIFDLEQIYNKMIHDMAEDLTTDYHGQSWVINFYFQRAKDYLREQSQKRTILEKQLYYRKGGKPVMKVMISQPMSGIPDAEVRRIQSELKERFGRYHIEVVDSFITEDVKRDISHPGVFYLGRTLQRFLSDVDAVYFVNGWQNARGCRIEREVCREYGIIILDDSFFKQENEVQIRPQFGSDKIRIIPCKNEQDKYGVEISTMNRQFDTMNPETIKHIPQIDGMEGE